MSDLRKLLPTRNEHTAMFREDEELLSEELDASFRATGEEACLRREH